MMADRRMTPEVLWAHMRLSHWAKLVKALELGGWPATTILWRVMRCGVHGAIAQLGGTGVSIPPEALLVDRAVANIRPDDRTVIKANYLGALVEKRGKDGRVELEHLSGGNQYGLARHLKINITTFERRLKRGRVDVAQNLEELEVSSDYELISDVWDRLK